jgi:hypothetical protein
MKERAPTILHEAEVMERFADQFRACAAAGIPEPGRDTAPLAVLVRRHFVRRDLAALAQVGLHYAGAARILTEEALYFYAAMDFQAAAGLADYDVSADLGGMWAHQVLFATHWVQAGMPVLRLPQPVVAELVMCDPKLAVPDELPMPWPAFVLVVGGTWDLGSEELRWVEFRQDSRDLWFAATRTTKERYYAHGQTLDQLLAPHDLTGFGDGLQSWRRERYGPELQRFIMSPDDDRVSLFGRRLAVAACQAIISGEPVARSTRSRKAAQRASVAVAAPCVEFVLGNNVRIHPRVAEAARAVARGEPQQHAVRWTVRGHFRNQVCGAGRAERRRTWIRPYFKGPAGAPTLLRDHVLGDETT